jgi:hypothetical protein
MSSGEWLGQLDDYWFGVGNPITNEEIANCLGLDANEVERLLDIHTDAHRTLRMPIVRIDNNGNNFTVNAYLDRATWRPTSDWCRVVESDDIARLFERPHQQIVGDILCDAFAKDVNLFEGDDVFANDVAALLAQFDRQNDVDTTHEGRFGPDHGLGL